MARKKKVKRFRVVEAVKELSRERIGVVPTARVVPDRKKKVALKHKKKAVEMMVEEE